MRTWMASRHREGRRRQRDGPSGAAARELAAVVVAVVTAAASAGCAGQIRTMTVTTSVPTPPGASTVSTAATAPNRTAHTGPCELGAKLIARQLRNVSCPAALVVLRAYVANPGQIRCRAGVPSNECDMANDYFLVAGWN